jgi:plasmid maintenance system killer protein
MQIDFDNQALRELYEKGRHRKYRLRPDIVDKFIHRVSQLNDAESIHDLMSLKGLHFKKNTKNITRFVSTTSTELSFRFNIPTQVKQLASLPS